MTFKAKLFKLGNSRSIYIPKEVYTLLEVGKEYEWNVYTSEAHNKDNVYTSRPESANVITSEDYTMEPDDTVKRADTFEA